MALSDEGDERGTMDSLRRTRSNNSTFSSWRSKIGLGGVARRTIGIGCLLLTVFLWTISNFMASVGGTVHA